MNRLTLEALQLISGIVPAADFLAGTVNTDVFSVKNHERALFVVYKGAGATGTSTLTVEACDDFTPSNTTAVPFRYQAITSGDTRGEVTDATAAGFTTTAGANQLYVIEVDAVELAKAGYANVRLHGVEVANDPCTGGIIGMLLGSRYTSEVPDTAIA